MNAGQLRAELVLHSGKPDNYADASNKLLDLGIGNSQWNNSLYCENNNNKSKIYAYSLL